jgi:hypothetical protein
MESTITIVSYTCDRCESPIATQPKETMQFVMRHDIEGVPSVSIEVRTKCIVRYLNRPTHLCAACRIEALTEAMELIKKEG